MYCIYCGNQIPDNCELCRYCGREVPEELIQRVQSKPAPTLTPTTTSTPISTSLPTSSTTPEKKRKKGSLIIMIIVAALVASLLLGATVGVIVYLCQFLPETNPDSENIPIPTQTQNSSSGVADASDLQKLLMQTWNRSGSFTINYYTYNVTYILDITQSSFSCSYNLSNEEITVAAFGYEVVSGNEIKRKGADFTYTITFNDAKTVMTISPAITSSEESETWYLTGFSSTSPSNQLTRDVFKNWTRTDGSDGMYIKHELEFGEDWFDYSYSIQNAGSGATNYPFEVVSENQVEDLDTGIIYTFTFNDAKNVMTVSPAISSDADSELWFYMGD